MEKKCLCGSKKIYSQCCKPYHEKNKICPHAIALLRARYCAYGMGLAQYIIDTTLEPASKNPLLWAKEIKESYLHCTFLGVKVYKIQNMPSAATIHFKANIFRQNQDISFEETSLFIKKNGIWFYQKPISFTH